MSFDSKIEQGVFCIALGLGIAGYVVLSIGLAGFLTKNILIIVMVGIFLTAIAGQRSFLPDVRQLLNPGKIIIAVTFILAVSFLAIQSFYPPYKWDATAYHLPFAKEFLLAHRTGYVPQNLLPITPQLLELLFTLLKGLFDDVSSQLLSTLMFILVAAALVGFSLRYRNWWCAVLCCILWISQPLVLWVASAAYLDIGFTLFVITGSYAFFNWMHSREKTWLILSAVLVGMSAGIKHQGLVFMAFLSMFCIWEGYRYTKSVRSPIYFALIAGIVAVPWYLQMAYYTGNPFFPLFSPLFGYGPWGEEYTKIFFSSHEKLGVARSFVNFIQLPWLLSFRQVHFMNEEPYLPIFISLPFILIVSVFIKEIRFWAIMVVSFLFIWFSTSQGLRYLMPVLPALIICLSISLADISMRIQNRPWRHIVMSFILIAASVGFYPAFRKSLEFVRQMGPPPVSASERDLFLSKALVSYPAIQWLNMNCGSNYRVWTVHATNLTYYADGILTPSDGYVGFIKSSERPLVKKHPAAEILKGSFELAILVDLPSFYEKLKALNVDYVLLALPGPVIWPDDKGFWSHFKLIDDKPYNILLQVVG